MSQWTEPGDIAARLDKLWKQGRILREVLEPSGLFPLSIPLQKPTIAEMGQGFAAVDAWIRRLQKGSRDRRGFGYDLVMVERNARLSGRNLIPTHAVVETSDEALRMLRKTKDAGYLVAVARCFEDAFPHADAVLQEWFVHHPFKALDMTEKAEQVIAVLRWFVEHPSSGLYLRQLDIPGVDTKFIEHNIGTLVALLRMVVPGHEGIKGIAGFEAEFGLKTKPICVRFRVLDDTLAVRGLTDLQVPLEQFAALALAARLVVITENEVNGLAFPAVAGGLVIFGLGYGVDVLRDVAWLTDVPVYYWGDLDTHGFAMLNQVRSFLPAAVSLLMDEQTLLRNRGLWSVENTPFKGSLDRLTSEETGVYHCLRDDVYGQGVRLEQERVPFGDVYAQVTAKCIVP